MFSKANAAHSESSEKILKVLLLKECEKRSAKCLVSAAMIYKILRLIYRITCMFVLLALTTYCFCERQKMDLV